MVVFLIGSACVLANAGASAKAGLSSLLSFMQALSKHNKVVIGVLLNLFYNYEVVLYNTKVVLYTIILWFFNLTYPDDWAFLGVTPNKCAVFLHSSSISVTTSFSNFSKVTLTSDSLFSSV